MAVMFKLYVSFQFKIIFKASVAVLAMKHNEMMEFKKFVLFIYFLEKLFDKIPEVGFEPTRACAHWILTPTP